MAEGLVKTYVTKIFGNWSACPYLNKTDIDVQEHRTTSFDCFNGGNNHNESEEILNVPPSGYIGLLNSCKTMTRFN